MKIKPAVKLDLGEMCKLCLLFFVSREYLIAYIYIFINTDLIFGEICIPFSFVANSFFLLLPTVNTLFHFKHILFINTLAVDT